RRTPADPAGAVPRKPEHPGRSGQRGLDAPSVVYGHPCPGLRGARRRRRQATGTVGPPPPGATRGSAARNASSAGRRTAARRAARTAFAVVVPPTATVTCGAVLARFIAL